MCGRQQRTSLCRHYSTQSSILGASTEIFSMLLYCEFFFPARRGTEERPICMYWHSTSTISASIAYLSHSLNILFKYQLWKSKIPGMQFLFIFFYILQSSCLQMAYKMDLWVSRMGLLQTIASSCLQAHQDKFPLAPVDRSPILPAKTIIEKILVDWSVHSFVIFRTCWNIPFQKLIFLLKLSWLFDKMNKNEDTM